MSHVHRPSGESSRFPRRDQVWTWLRDWIVGITVAGLSGGLAALVFTEVLHLVQSVGYGSGSLTDAIRHAPVWQRVLTPTLGALLAGSGWWWLRSRGTVLTPTAAMATTPRSPAVGPRAVTRSWLDAALQVVIVGAGASIGREGAPRQSAAALTAYLVSDPRRRRVLVASAAGAGLAGVYTTPLAGALFTLEVTLRTTSWREARRAALPALAASTIAVLVARPATHDLPAYDVTITPPTGPDVLVAVLAAALAGPAAWLFARVMQRARAARRPQGRRLLATLVPVGIVLGFTSCVVPTVIGNGTVLVTDILTGHPPWLVLAALLLTKPLLTWAYVRAGAEGGLLTPGVAIGATLGALVATGAHAAGLDVGLPHVALVTAAMFLAVTQQAPWFAAVFVWEITTAPTSVLPLALVLTLLGHHGYRAVRRTDAHRPPTASTRSGQSATRHR